MGNPFNPYDYGCGCCSVATNEYNPYTTCNTTTTCYNVPTTTCDISK